MKGFLGDILAELCGKGPGIAVGDALRGELCAIDDGVDRLNGVLL